MERDAQSPAVGLQQSRVVSRLRVGVCDYRNAALEGFLALGSTARPAVPELTRLARDAKSEQVSYWALHALAYVGRDGLPPLIAAVRDPQHRNRPCAASMLGYAGRHGADVSAAVPVLARCLQDPDEGVVAAAEALGNLAIEPDISVPALAAALADRRGYVRYSAVVALEGFGKAARPAVPALLNAIKDSDNDVRSRAKQLLREIAPEELGQVEQAVHGGAG